jgi:hypothetical protein
MISRRHVCYEPHALRCSLGFRLTDRLTRIVPMVSLLLLCSFLDRTNVGNAQIIGLERDLGITNHQYEIGLTVFYVTYILV